jgi:hypothetical protein
MHPVLRFGLHFFCYRSRRFYLISRLDAAVVAPTRRLYQITNTIFKGNCAANVVHQLSPTAKCHCNRVERADDFCKPLNTLFIFGLKSADQPVPDHQPSTMISMQVFKVAAMMYAVVGWRIEQQFNKTGQTAYPFSMYPKLLNKADLLHK